MNVRRLRASHHRRFSASKSLSRFALCCSSLVRISPCRLVANFFASPLTLSAVGTESSCSAEEHEEPEDAAETFAFVAVAVVWAVAATEEISSPPIGPHGTLVCSSSARSCHSLRTNERLGISLPRRGGQRRRRGKWCCACGNVLSFQFIMIRVLLV